MEDLGLDLGEYKLTERERLLKRAGVFHLWREPGPALLSVRDELSEQESAFSDIPANCDVPAHVAALFHGKQFPVRSLWLYAGLAEDLKMSPSSQRLVLFRKIQEATCAHLGWEEKDIASWPMGVEAAILSYGLERFQPQRVLCFARNLDTPEVKELKSLLPAICPQAKFFLLPDVTDMAAGNQELKNAAWRVLQDIS